ncbi:hypothetical protein E3U26_06365 [Paracoccus ferrooxidans]|nr:hypothetical protein E3U26_06365 [Paracoccus ferrooxidans]
MGRIEALTNMLGIEPSGTAWNMPQAELCAEIAKGTIRAGIAPFLGQILGTDQANHLGEVRR